MNSDKKSQQYLFGFKSNNIAPAKGRILIAEPLLQGKHFSRSVILLTEHNDSGSMGLVLNKPLLLNVNDMVDLFPSCHSPLFLGGPVHTDHLFYIHTLGNLIPKSYPLYNNLFWGGDLNVLRQLLDQNIVNPQQVRFFTGYAGWNSSQLADEIEDKSWIVSLIDTNTIMDIDTDNLWEDAVTELGKNYRHWLNFPQNPMYN